MGSAFEGAASVIQATTGTIAIRPLPSSRIKYVMATLLCLSLKQRLVIPIWIVLTLMVRI